MNCKIFPTCRFGSLFFLPPRVPFHEKLGPNGVPIFKFVFLSLQEHPKVSSFSSATGLLISGTVRAINILSIVQLLGQSQARIQDLYFPACGHLEKLRVAYQSIHRSPW